MATGHINPGYNFPVSNLERINKLPNPTENKIINGLTPEISNKRWLLLQPSLPNDILENIRRKARESWNTVGFHENNSSTTYLGNFQIKNIDEPIKLRPTSPTRMNNPHPSAIFLTCRLHHLPGFHRDDISPIKNEVNQAICKSKSSFSETESKDIVVRAQNVNIGTAKYSVNENRTPNSDKISINSGYSRGQTSQEFARPKSTISLFSNQSSDQTAFTTTKVGRPHTSFPKYHNNRSANARSRCQSSIYQKTEYPRGDYSIHYQWPVTLPHHHLF